MNLCVELAIARREAGLSQEALASRLGVLRERLARLEAGTGSVQLLVEVMSAIPMRVTGLAKGGTIVEQLRNLRERRGLSVDRLASRTGLDPRTIQSVEAGRGTVASLCAILAIIAPQAKRQRSMKAIWDYDRGKYAEGDTRFTPAGFVHDLADAFGPISLDPCGHHLSPVQAERKIILPDCGLTNTWGPSAFVYVNPPFSDLARWLKKSNDEWASGKVRKLAFLIPSNRLDVREFYERTSPVTTTLLLRDRLRFGNPRHPDGKHRAPFPLALTLWGCEQIEIARFRSRWRSLVLPPQDDADFTATADWSLEACPR